MDIPIKNSAELQRVDFNSCIHTRKLIQMVDVDLDDQRIPFFKKHAKACQSCQKKLKDIERSLVRFEFFVPKPKASAELKNEYETELRVLLKNVGLSSEAKIQLKKIKFIQNIQDVVRDIELVLNNKKVMLMAIAVASLSFGILNLLLK